MKRFIGALTVLSVLIPSLAFASATLVDNGSASQVFCSGPTAPGWNVSLPGGGCGMSVFVPFTRALPDGTPCPFFWGCMVKQ